jgi:MoaA/NifB/PqqE/SkfB family radical SAM enzyme
MGLTNHLTGGGSEANTGSMSDPGSVRAPRPPEVASRSDVTITLDCNNACRFCPRPTLRHLHVAGAEALDERLVTLRRQSSRVTLSGGEVTVLRSLVDRVARCRELGFEQIGIITNGRNLADPVLTGRLVRAGLTEACVTVYDLRSAVHDGLTSTPGSLAETLCGLDRLLAEARKQPGLLVRVNTLLCVDNADGLVALLRNLATRGVGRFLVGDMLLSERYPDALAHDQVVELARGVAEDPLLGGVAVEFRGFPLCVLRDVGHVEVQPHDVDTVLLEARDRDAYFAEFRDSYMHVEACEGCVARDRCPGVQKRYVEQCGEDGIVPLAAPIRWGGSEWEVSDSELDAARRELERFPPWQDPGRVEVNTTTACPFRCTYCGVDLGEAHASERVLDRAVDLLLTSSAEKLELQFFGGEPLVRRPQVERTIRRGTALARDLGKRLRFVVTTSGLLLGADVLAFLREFDVEVLYSLDGPVDVMRRYRPLARSRADVTGLLEQNLRRLVDSSIDHFVNLVVTPEAAADVERRVEHVLGLGARRVQVCYAMAPGWTDAAQDAFCEGLSRCAERMADAGAGLRLQNIGGAAEPIILSPDMIVDVDGTVYHDLALFGERLMPGLRDAFRVGDVFALTSFDGLRRSREENLVRLRRAYPDPDSAPRQLLEQQLAFGWRIHQVQESLAPLAVVAQSRRPTRARAARVVDRNPLQEKVLRRSLAHQARFIQKRPDLLALPLLMLENPCEHDCLFCMAKPLPPTPFPVVERWLAQNRTGGLNLTRLGIAGNEPLLHPDIDDILTAAREAGFERFEVLTSGAPLAQVDRARALYAAGARDYAIPLYAADPVIHDAITQSPGSHADTMRGIENLRALGARVHIHANLLRQNLDHVAALERLVVKRWELPLAVLPIRAKAANLPYDELAPRYSEIVARANVRCLVAFPLCVAAQLQGSALPSADVLSDVLKVYVLDQPFTKPERCADCRWRTQCAGTFGAYLDLYGDGELEPR